MGIIISIFVFSRVIDWMIEQHNLLTFFFFLGLVIGIVPFLLNSIQFRKSFKYNHYILLGIVAILVALIGLFREEGIGEVLTNLSASDYLLLFVAGWLASSAMILPGISGSFVLLLLGVYTTSIDAIKNFNIDIIIIVGLGVIIGLLVTSKIINYLLNHFTISTYAVITGLVVGSAFVIFPGIPQGILSYVLCILSFIIGLSLTYVLGYIEIRNRR